MLSRTHRASTRLHAVAVLLLGGCATTDEPPFVPRAGATWATPTCDVATDSDVGEANWELVVARNAWTEDPLPNGVDLDAWNNEQAAGGRDARGCAHVDSFGGIDEALGPPRGLGDWGVFLADREVNSSFPWIHEPPRITYRLRLDHLSPVGDDACVGAHLEIEDAAGDVTTLQTVGSLAAGELRAVFRGTFDLPVLVRQPEGYPYPACALSGCVAFDTELTARGVWLVARVDDAHTALAPGSAMGTFVRLGLPPGSAYDPSAWEPDSLGTQLLAPALSAGGTLYSDQFWFALSGAADLHHEADDALGNCFGSGDGTADGSPNALSVGIPFTSL